MSFAFEGEVVLGFEMIFKHVPGLQGRKRIGAAIFERSQL